MENSGKKTSQCEHTTTIKDNLREALARKTANNMFGQGFIFQSDDKNINKVFNKFKKMNNLLNLLSYAERYLSLWGRVIITINKTKSGDFMLNIPSPFFFQGIGKAFVQPQLAVLWQRINVDTKNYVIKTTYDTKKVVNELYNVMGSESVRVFDKEAEVFKDFQIEKEWVHNLGFVPVVEFTNLPIKQFIWNNTEFLELADWWPAQQFEDLFIQAYNDMLKELKYCHTRVLIDGANQEQIQRLANQNLIDNDFIIETDSGSEFKIIAGNGDFTKYTQAMNMIMDLYYKFANNARFSEGGGAQKTVAETSTIRSSLIETIQSKILHRNQSCYELIEKVLACYGLVDYYADEHKFDFKIVGNIIKEESSYIDNLIKKVEVGAITIQDMIQEINNFTSYEAEEKYQAIKKFNEQNDIMTNLMGMKLDTMLDNSESAISETGEHKDRADKQGIS